MQRKGICKVRDAPCEDAGSHDEALIVESIQLLHIASTSNGSRADRAQLTLKLPRLQNTMAGVKQRGHQLTTDAPYMRFAAAFHRSDRADSRRPGEGPAAEGHEGSMSRVQRATVVDALQT